MTADNIWIRVEPDGTLIPAARMKEWMASDLGHLDIMVVQIDGMHIAEDIVLVAAIGIDGEGAKHPLGLIEGATEHSAVVQALIDSDRAKISLCECSAMGKIK
jgi:hypothetical protein